MQTISFINSSNQLNRYVSFKQNITQISQDIEMIETALWEMITSSDSPISIDELTYRTGLSKPDIFDRLNHPSAERANKLWSYAQDAMTRRDSDKLERIERPYRDQLQLQKKRQKAIEMIKLAVSENRKITYQRIQQVTGLDKKEIDMLISDYVQYLNAQSQRAKINKELQAKWYEEHKNDELETGSWHSRRDEAYEQSESIRDAIYRISDKHIKPSYDEISLITGIDKDTIRNRIYSPRYTKLKELYKKAVEDYKKESD